MPLFYFHLRGPAGLEPDEIGLECPGLEAAYLEACRTVPGMAAEFVHDGRNPMEFAFEVADATGAPLLEVPFGEMLRDVGPPRRPASPGVVSTVATTAERAQQLAQSIGQQVENLHEAMRTAQRHLEVARKLR